MSKTRIWFVPTSPRSPYKIKPELKLLSEFDGCEWSGRTKEGKRNQLKFARRLKESQFFEGSVSRKRPRFSARDRLRAPKMFGFAYVDPDGNLRITESGRKLIEGESIENIFLRQLLKWQYPSYQHGGMPEHAWRYQKNVKFFPFYETVRVICKLKKLSSEELMIFLLPCFKRSEFDEAIEKIQNFRECIKGLRRSEKRKLTYNTHFNEFRSVYAEDIDKGEISTRETPTKNVNSFIKKKMRNSRDYADAAFRYFQYTGLLSRKRNHLYIPKIREQDIYLILDMEPEFNENYEDVNKFYGHLGDPNSPQLPWESSELFKERAKYMKDIIVREFPKDRKILQSIDLNNATFNELNHTYRSAKKRELARKLRENPEEIIEEYSRILDRDVYDPPLFFEWNTWRGFLTLGCYCELKPNFKLDDELQPISPAPGERADIEVIYCNDFAVMVEVTLKTGDSQYYAESEPVSRHVRKFKKSKNIQTFGLFMAPEIYGGTAEFFLIEHKMKDPAFVVPINLEQFNGLLNSAKERGFDKNNFKEFFEESKRRGSKMRNRNKWRKCIGELVHEYLE